MYAILSVGGCVGCQSRGRCGMVTFMIGVVIFVFTALDQTGFVPAEALMGNERRVRYEDEMYGTIYMPLHPTTYEQIMRDLP